MFTRWLIADDRAPSAVAVATGYVTGRRLTFDKLSRDSSRVWEKGTVTSSLEYTRLAMLDVTAGLTDEELYDHAKSVGGESFPIELADRLLAGENAVRVYRDHRRMIQKQLAGAAGINPLYLSQIERSVRTGSVRTLAALAEALGVNVDDLI